MVIEVPPEDPFRDLLEVRDTLVLAAGAGNHYFGHDEWEPYAPGLKAIEDARDPASRAAALDWVAEVADIIQIGARNMQNYSLLKHAGRAGKPFFLYLAHTMPHQPVL